jgi:hypothetical protein
MSRLNDTRGSSPLAERNSPANATAVARIRKAALAPRAPPAGD